MLRDLKKIQGYALHATDGELGGVSDFFFDDDTWTIRYLVVKTGSWLFGKQVLIAPVAVDVINTADGIIRINLTREQVKNSPPIEADQPVSRQYEAEYFRHYAWLPYWGGTERWGFGMYPATLAAPRAAAENVPPRPQGDPNLRSTSEVEDYTVAAQDGGLGEVGDFIIDDHTWAIRYLVVNTGSWLANRQTLISPLWINRVSFTQNAIAVDLPRQVIKDAPRYDPSEPITRDYEVRLFRYYGSEEFIDYLRLKNRMPVGGKK